MPEGIHKGEPTIEPRKMKKKKVKQLAPLWIKNGGVCEYLKGSIQIPIRVNSTCNQN